MLRWLIIREHTITGLGYTESHKAFSRGSHASSKRSHTSSRHARSRGLHMCSVLKYLYIQHKRQAAVTSSDEIARNMSERRFD